jgi:phage major head subunit gpT-like protein
MAALTPQFFQLLEAEEKDVFFNTFEAQELLYPQLFNVQPSTKAYEDRIRIARLGTFATKAEGTPISYDDPAQGTQVRTVHQTYGLGFRITLEMMQDDQFGIMRQMSSDLAASAADHQERLAWSLVNDGFTGTTFTGLEGDTLFTSTHTLLKGSTATVNRSNILSPAVALSQTGIEDILTLAMTAESDEGRFIKVDPRTLVVHPEEAHNAFVLLNTEFKPGSSDNDRSTVQTSRSGLNVLSVPYLSSTSNWYVFGDNSKTTLTWNSRMPLEFDTSTDSDTRDMKFTSLYRASVMWSEWRACWGSQS